MYEELRILVRAIEDDCMVHCTLLCRMKKDIDGLGDREFCKKLKIPIEKIELPNLNLK